MIVKLLTEHHLEFLSLKGGCRSSSETVKLLEVSCRGSIYRIIAINLQLDLSSFFFSVQVLLSEKQSTCVKVQNSDP